MQKLLKDQRFFFKAQSFFHPKIKAKRLKIAENPAFICSVSKEAEGVRYMRHFRKPATPEDNFLHSDKESVE